MTELRYTEIGYIKSIRGCIVVVGGFKSCINGQMINFGYGTIGTIVGFDEQEAYVLILKQSTELKTGDECRASLEPFNVPVGKNFIGRVVNPLCEPFDGLGPIQKDEDYSIFPPAPPILVRQPLKVSLETGVKVVDAMLPMGFGQRMLILGNKMSGKTTLVTDTILNQKHTGVICIYCAIGKARSQLARVVQLFQDHEAFKYSIIVAAPSSSPPGQMYLAPYVACSLGEYFRDRGQHVFVGFDDFTKHAWCYREISLLLGRPPGRDSYPGDIFYLHSKMIERACHFDKAHGEGSMTFLPIVEILEGDLTAFVPSNLVSMTDGQLMLDAALFGEGQRPGLDLGLSVSRVGTKVQWPIIKQLAGPLRLEFLQFRELQRISKLKTTGLSDEVTQKLKNGEILKEILRQDKDNPIRMEALIIILYAFNKKLLHRLSMPEITLFQTAILEYTQKNKPGFVELLRERRKMDQEIETGLKEIIEKYIKEIEDKRNQGADKPKGKEDDIISNIGRDVLDEATTKK